MIRAFSADTPLCKLFFIGEFTGREEIKNPMLVDKPNAVALYSLFTIKMDNSSPFFIGHYFSHSVYSIGNPYVMRSLRCRLVSVRGNKPPLHQHRGWGVVTVALLFSIIASI
jgi:hypothetical protein